MICTIMIHDGWKSESKFEIKGWGAILQSTPIYSLQPRSQRRATAPLPRTPWATLRPPWKNVAPWKVNKFGCWPEKLRREVEVLVVKVEFLICRSNANEIEVDGAKRRPPSEQRKFMPHLKFVLPPLTKTPGYVAEPSDRTKIQFVANLFTVMNVLVLVRIRKSDPNV